MASKALSLKVSVQPRKKGFKNLTDSIDIDSKTTIEHAKMRIAAASGVRDYNRIALLDPVKYSIIKDRKELVVNQKSVMDKKEIMVKDLGMSNVPSRFPADILGPQLGWRTVYLIEYAGPMLIHLLMALPLRSYTFKGTTPASPLSYAQQLSLAMIVLHFVKRELETLFLHKFSANTMPAFNIFKNSGHYWILSGVNIAYWIYSPTALAAKSLDTVSTACVYLGMVLYAVGEVMNLYTHIVLSNLRTTGGTERGIPRGLSFSWVTCPNYLWELIAWVGVLLVTRSLGTLVFLVVGGTQMVLWADGKEWRYRIEFGDKYAKKRYPLIPGVPTSGRKTKAK